MPAEKKVKAAAQAEKGRVKTFLPLNCITGKTSLANQSTGRPLIQWGRWDMKKARVIKGYQSAYPQGIILKQDDLVCVEKRESKWKGWIWCTAPDGKQGWTPESFLDIKQDIARVLLDYDATELSVTIGEELDILKEESGWYWCRNARGKIGWVPLECVKVS